MNVVQSTAARLAGSGFFWAAFVGVLFAAPLGRALQNRKGPPPPPLLGTFPQFSLQDDRGAALDGEKLRGHAFFANVLPVKDPATRFVAASEMRTLQHRARNLGDSLFLVSFSPDGDPAALAEVRREKPSSHRWALVAGEPPAVASAFAGGATLLLVDGQGRIRGRYFGGDDDRALADAALVLQ